MIERGVIRNRAYASQIKDFSGLRFGKVTPTDIDAFLEFQGKLFIFIEAKHSGAPLPYGQKLAIERLVDACHEPPNRRAVAIIIDHFEDCKEDVDFANSPVREFRWFGVWRKPRIAGITLFQAIEAVRKPYLRIVK